jgi:cytochrome c-type biogenesis protein CcmH/NrfF
MAQMRLLGTLLVVAGLSPLLLIAYAMVKAYNNHATVDAQFTNRALILTWCGIPVVVLGLAFLVVAAFSKRRARRIDS